MFVLEKHGVDPSVVQYEPPRDPLSRIKRALRRESLRRSLKSYSRTAPAGMSFFTDDRTVYGADPWKHLPESDVLQLHWISLFVDYESFFGSVPAGKPLVWTMHGMEAITGGCHYAYGCEKFMRECGACPQLGSRSSKDLTARVWRRKRDSYQKLWPGQLHIVCPSRWLQGEVKRSSLLSHAECTHIPYGLDTEVFAPRDRRYARESLGIPYDSRVVLFVADGVEDPRKGLHLLGEAISGLGSSFFLLSVGSGSPRELAGGPHLHIPQVQHDGILSCIYSAADVFVVPSLQDNLPNTILESLACGVPVAGFEVGGVPDAVRPGVTGLLAKAGDVSGLRNIILELLQSEEKRAEMSANCRKVALQEYSLEAQARRYANLYRELICKSPSGRAMQRQ